MNEPNFWQSNNVNEPKGTPKIKVVGVLAPQFLVAGAIGCEARRHRQKNKPILILPGQLIRALRVHSNHFPAVGNSDTRNACRRIGTRNTNCALDHQLSTISVTHPEVASQ